MYADNLTFGNQYQILFNVLDETNNNIGSLVYYGMIPNNTTQQTGISDTKLSTVLLHYSTSATPQLKIQLGNFNFNLSFFNKLSVASIKVIAHQWTK